ncbi:MAG: hypothetical protein H0V44_01360 [Planctomycetes bacterium]|nr:hypothetical protein [Planctomycetota bacterium]
MRSTTSTLGEWPAIVLGLVVINAIAAFAVPPAVAHAQRRQVEADTAAALAASATAARDRYDAMRTASDEAPPSDRSTLLGRPSVKPVRMRVVLDAMADVDARSSLPAARDLPTPPLGERLQVITGSLEIATSIPNNDRVEIKYALPCGPDGAEVTGPLWLCYCPYPQESDFATTMSTIAAIYGLPVFGCLPDKGITEAVAYDDRSRCYYFRESGSAKAIEDAVDALAVKLTLERIEFVTFGGSGGGSWAQQLLAADVRGCVGAMSLSGRRLPESAAKRGFSILATTMGDDDEILLGNDALFARQYDAGLVAIRLVTAPDWTGRGQERSFFHHKPSDQARDVCLRFIRELARRPDPRREWAAPRSKWDVRADVSLPGFTTGDGTVHPYVVAAPTREALATLFHRGSDVRILEPQGRNEFWYASPLAQAASAPLVLFVAPPGCIARDELQWDLRYAADAGYRALAIVGDEAAAAAALASVRSEAVKIPAVILYRASGADLVKAVSDLRPQLACVVGSDKNTDLSTIRSVAAETVIVLAQSDPRDERGLLSKPAARVVVLPQTGELPPRVAARKAETWLAELRKRVAVATTR